MDDEDGLIYVHRDIGPDGGPYDWHEATKDCFCDPIPYTLEELEKHGAWKADKH